MSEKIKKKDFIKNLAIKLNIDEKEALRCFDGTIEVFYDAFKEGKSVTIENFGNFYLEKKSENYVFKFNPSQKLRSLLGWSSSYKSN